MKDNYDGLNDLLKQVAVEVATTIPETFNIDVNVIYFPQLGFNIAIPLNARGEPAFNGTGGDWELIFVTENRAYFKDFRMREMDENLGDIYGLICGKTTKSFIWRKTLIEMNFSREGNRNCLRTSATRTSIRRSACKSIGYMWPD